LTQFYFATVMLNNKKSIHWYKYWTVSTKWIQTLYIMV
jgi:hypothetical protein